MIKKKICMLGPSAVGKTSLVRRFVKSMFDEKYQTTIGVKVDEKTLEIDGQALKLMLWDFEGTDAFAELEPAYLRGASGCLLVADGTRAETLDEVLEIHSRVVRALGEVPIVLLLINKSDLRDQWEIEESHLTELAAQGWKIHQTSALDGSGVEAAFLDMGRLVLGAGGGPA
jgi:hypothetical protein